MLGRRNEIGTEIDRLQNDIDTQLAKFSVSLFSEFDII